MSTIGEASAPSQHTINYDALLSTTFMQYRANMVDNIFKNNAFLAAMRMYDGVKLVGGGERIQIPLMIAENDTFKSYSGYEMLNVKGQEGMTSAFYPWAEIGGTISISRREERQNSGEAKMLSLLESKIKQAEMSIQSVVNTQLVQGTQQGTAGSQTFGPGNSTKDLYPLGYFLPKACATNPAVGGNIGNISSSANSFWRSRGAVMDNATADTGNAFGIAVTTYAGLIIGFKRMYNYCSRQADKSAPNLILTNQNTYEIYESAVDVRSRLYNTDLSAIGFDSIKLKGASMIWDELTPNIDEGYLPTDASYATNSVEGTAFFINTKFMQLSIDEESDFITTPFVSPENQTAKTAKVIFMGNMTCSNLQKCGVCYAIDGTIAS